MTGGRLVSSSFISCKMPWRHRAPRTPVGSLRVGPSGDENGSRKHWSLLKCGFLNFTDKSGMVELDRWKGGRAEASKMRAARIVIHICILREGLGKFWAVKTEEVMRIKSPSSRSMDLPQMKSSHRTLRQHSLSQILCAFKRDRWYGNPPIKDIANGVRQRYRECVNSISLLDNDS